MFSISIYCILAIKRKKMNIIQALEEESMK